MSAQILSDCKIFLGKYDISGDLNQVALDYSAESQQVTSFGDNTHRRIGGLKSATVSVEGHWKGGADEIDDVLFNNLKVVNIPFSVSPDSAEGTTAFFMLSNQADYAPGAALGEVFKFSCSAESMSNLVRGVLMVNATKTASGNSTGRQLGAVSADQKLYAALHVVATTGSPTLDVIIQSDDTSSFLSPTSRITFSTKTAAGYEWATPIDGAITDDWFRANFTFGGTGSITFAVVVGIL